MPIVACPQCPTKLRVPDDATGSVRCPRCKCIFPAASAQEASASDVVPLPPPPPPRRAPAKAPASPPRVKAVIELEDDEYEDVRPRSKHRWDDDEGEDDRPRRKRRRDYDDEDDEDDYRPPVRKGKAGFAPAKVGVLLLNVSFWCYCASLALMTLAALLIWIGTNMLANGFVGGGPAPAPGRPANPRDGEWVLMLIRLPGILGLANWITAMVGFGFCIAGPAKARAMAITATALGAAHLVLMLVTFSNMTRPMGFAPGADAFVWPMLSSMVPILDTFLPLVIEAPRMMTESGSYVVAVLAGVCEVLRLAFAMLTVKALATAAKDYDAAQKSQFGLVAGILLPVGTMLLVLVAFLIARSSPKMIGPNFFGGGLFVLYLCLTAMTVMPLIATHLTMRSLARKARR